MSRKFVVNNRGEMVREKYKPKKYTPAWEEARAKRKARRRGLVQQARNDNGFIVVEVGGHQRYVDPGPINRELFINARRQLDREKISG